MPTQQYELPFDYSDNHHKQLPKPSFSKYVVKTLVPFMLFGSVLLIIMFPPNNELMPFSLTLIIIAGYWISVWSVYAIIKIIHHQVTQNKQLEQQTKAEIRSQIQIPQNLKPSINTQVAENSPYGYAKSKSGAEIQYRAKAVTHNTSHQSVFDDLQTAIPSEKPVQGRIINPDKAKQAYQNYKRKSTQAKVLTPQQHTRNKQILITLKPQFMYIKRLIKLRKYKEARYALSLIDHPKADLWLEKLNEIDPNYGANPIKLQWVAMVSIAVLLILNLIVALNR